MCLIIFLSLVIRLSNKLLSSAHPSAHDLWITRIINFIITNEQITMNKYFLITELYIVHCKFNIEIVKNYDYCIYHA